MTVMSPPLRATYRLQFNAGFPLAKATAIVPYLAELGVSHVYASPLLKARAGSAHGYDIVDHNALNPEIGDEADFVRFVETLRRHGMGLIVDIVPNHMGVGGDDNHWWLDVLEHGEASTHAQAFDIDWHPVNRVLRNRVLLPFLGDHYGTVLEGGELHLALSFRDDMGAFDVSYGPHRFPIDPRTYPMILAEVRLILGTAAPDPACERLDAIIAGCLALPRRTETTVARKWRRQQESVVYKRMLARLCQDYPMIQKAIGDRLSVLNGEKGRPDSFDGLHRLLQAQAYRLAYWRVATDEINYRRFFDINDLAGVRVEAPAIFEATHGLIRRWVTEGQVDGLRLDHIDGLSDPLDYCRRLQALCRTHRPASQDPFPLWVEKVLEPGELLPTDWPVAGTTGYEAGRLINDLFIRRDAADRMDRSYRRFCGEERSFSTLLYHSRKHVIEATLSGEMSVLANLLYGIAQQDRHSRDFTYRALRSALTEIIACLPVYRTYIREGDITAADRHHLERATQRARTANRRSDPQIFDFIVGILLREPETVPGGNHPTSRIRFIRRFQQFTAPVMAKGKEDTAFYNYHRLVSLNEIGSDPGTFGISLGSFHEPNSRRRDCWPQSLVTTATHDSKRGEDVRARLNVLSEVPEQWQQRVRRWRGLNQHLRGRVAGAPAPSAADEYLLYQTLFGSWPLQAPDPEGHQAYLERILAYMNKAVREAKTHSAWINPDPDYEGALDRFVRGVLEPTGSNGFLKDFIPWQQRLVRFGLLNGLSQTLLRLTIPGVPDTYQGNEFWTMDLVDPDNRHPVDFTARQEALEALRQQYENPGPEALAIALRDNLEDGRIKLYLIWRILTLRRETPELFHHGDYQPLPARGAREDHVCSFARNLGQRQCIVVAPRWFASLNEAGGTVCRETDWRDTRLIAPGPWSSRRYRDIFTGRTLQALDSPDGALIPLATAMPDFPVALLIPE